MQHRPFIILLLVFSLPLFISASADTNTSQVNKSKQAHTGTLSIKIANITVQHGTARIAVFNNKNNWLKTPVYSQVLEINIENCKESSCIWEINNAPYGDYGIAVYHDKNRNEKLDTNILGIPKEDYGFSNNQRGMFGSPNWRKAKFSLNASKTEHVVRLN